MAWSVQGARYSPGMALPVIHNPRFVAELPQGHRFPMPKYGAIAKILVEDGVVPEGGFHAPGEAPAGWIALAHDARYVDQVLHNAVPEAISRQIGFAVTPSVTRRSRHACAGTVLAARLALESGLACSTAGGSHHAKRSHGAGCCVFNEVGVAASLLVSEGACESILVFDCDVHQGDGTAEIFAGDPRVTTVSIHCQSNFPARKEVSDLDVGLPDGLDDAAYLEILRDTLNAAFKLTTPDLVFYNAGVDVHAEDRLGRLALSDKGIEERDRQVIGYFRDRSISLAGLMGGGYDRDADVVARRHTILHRVASEFL